MAISDFHDRSAQTDAYAAWHRAGRQLGHFWRDLRTRMPRHSLLIAAGGAAGITLIGATLSFAPPAFEIATTPLAQQPAVKCEAQAWPHLDDTCLRRQNENHTNRAVRVISLDRDAPTHVPLPKAAGGEPTKASPSSGGSRTR
jgi:hypothetical protein